MLLLETSTSCFLVSSEGALYVIMPYDYPRPLFEILSIYANKYMSTLSINAMMTLVTLITMMTIDD